MKPNETLTEINAMAPDATARDRLMQAATKLFALHGLEGTSTRDIAKEADLNISLISYYFGGKEGLYKTILLEFAQKAQKETERILKSLDLHKLTRENFQEAMKAFIYGMLPWKFANREVHTLLQREMMEGLPHSKDIYENIFRDILETVVGLYQTGQKKGFIKKDINPLVLFFSMAHATDTYLNMNQCPTSLCDRLLKLPDQIDAYSNQIYLIFVEGVLV